MARILSLSSDHIAVLLAPINPRRVKKLDGNSYVEQHDVRAMLTRVFGFGGWSLRQLHEPRMVARIEKQNRNGEDRVAVTYMCSVAIVLHLAERTVEYEGTGSHTATMSPGNEGDAHDSALKSADSAALKRAAMNLGDQFGLGLYANGSLNPLVRKVWDGFEFVTADTFRQADPETTDAPES